ncbi:MAG: glycosylhydrolase-like jelly roll fold domain-containing protein, partial [Planctomycetota bacterium]
VLEKLEALVAAGATVIGPKPLQVPGRRDLARRTARLKSLADKMWGAGDGKAVRVRTYEKGKVVSGMTPRQWLARQGIGPDFRCETEGANLDYIHRQTNHRQTDEADIYFIRNESLSAVSADCLFRVQDRRPWLWHPDTAEVEPIPAYRSTGDGTALCLDLPAGGSVFVVFEAENEPESIVAWQRRYAQPDPSMPPARMVAREAATTAIETWQNGEYHLDDGEGGEKSLRVNDLPAPKSVEGPWNVAFTRGWGAPDKITLPRLMSWTEHELEGVRYYSGAGVYSKTIEVPSDWLGTERRVLLDLGEVREVAEVHVNGKSAGVLWKPPFAIDVTSLLKPGTNSVEIEVMNMWINRLTGDMGRPAEERFCKTNQTPYASDVEPGSGETWKVQPSGLLGPVRLLPGLIVVP